MIKQKNVAAENSCYLTTDESNVARWLNKKKSSSRSKTDRANILLKNSILEYLSKYLKSFGPFAIC